MNRVRCRANGTASVHWVATVTDERAAGDRAIAAEARPHLEPEEEADVQH